MLNKFNLFLTVLLFLSIRLYAVISSSEVPTPFINSVNIITGEALPPSDSIKLEYYQVGYNDVGGNSVYLPKGDFRINRVKLQKTQGTDNSWNISSRYFYFPNYTEVFDNLNHKSIYRYTNSKSLIAIEHYSSPAPGQYSLYRKEKLFWKNINNHPYLTSRVLEDSQGIVQVCYALYYNEQGQLSKETLFGSLSGDSHIPLLIQSDGYPENNGVESYSINYAYAPYDPTLLVKREEDNGFTTYYTYHEESKQLASKRINHTNQVFTRYFYLYDDQGLLCQTIIDDGQAEADDDLSHVSYRQILRIQSKQESPAFGQPLVTESLSLDLLNNTEVLLEKTVYTYSKNGNLIQQDFYDAKGDLCYDVKMFYDENNHLLSSVDSRGETTTALQKNKEDSHRSYQEGQHLRLLDRYGNETESVYDDFGRLIKTISPSVLDAHHQPVQPIQIQEYDIRDQMIKSQDGNGHVTCIHYNARGKPTNIQYPDGSSESFSYFLDGSLKEHVNPRGLRKEFKRDVLCKRKTHVEQEEAESQEKISTKKIDETSSFLFSQDHSFLNNRNQYVRQQEIVDSYGCRQIIIYDALNRPETIYKLNAFGTRIAEQQMRYDANNNKVLEQHLVIANGEPIRTFTIAWLYDSLNRVVGIIEGKGSERQKSTYYRYNLFGQLKSIEKPDGTIISHSYDEEGRLSFLTASDQSVAYQYLYDDKNRLIEVHDLIHSTAIARQYDDLNRLTEENLGNDLSIKNRYDSVGRRTQMILPDHSRVDYVYDGLNLQAVQRLSSTGTLLYQHLYQYDSHTGSLIGHCLIGESGSISYTKDALGRLSRIQSDWWSQTIPEDGFDPSHQLIRSCTEDSAGNYQSSFSYADNQQLASENGLFNHHYQCDSLYNRLSLDDQDWCVNEINQLENTPEAEYKYDRNGNLCHKKMANGSCIRYDYDALNRLSRAVIDQQKAFEYRYDAFDRQLVQLSYDWDEEQSSWKLSKTEYLVYDQNREIGKSNANHTLIQLRILGLGKGAEIGAAVALELEGRLFAPIHDGRGSVCCVVDVENQKVAECYRYSAYGDEQIFDGEGQSLLTSLIGNPWRFSSKRTDEMGLIFFGKRYYDPQSGRWLTPDPLFFYDTPNVYAFLQNNPLNLYDLYGLFSIRSIWNYVLEQMYSYSQFIFTEAQHLYQTLQADLKMPSHILEGIKRAGQNLLGESVSLLISYQFEETEMGVYGKGEISPQIRVTFINGILTNQASLNGNLDMISTSHGGINIHYIFRPTAGWMWDITRALLIKTAFSLGFRSEHAYLLAQKWKELIAEMGGVEGGGLIIHYAHSLGGSDTDRARELLTAEEQKMIRVISIGSSTVIKNIGFQSVWNYVSLNDGVGYLDPIGRIRHRFIPDANIVFRGVLWDRNPYPICDHLLTGDTYKNLIEELGEQFILEFLH